MAKNKVKIQYVGPLAAAWRIFADFSSNSTVHGVKYLGERKRHWIERLFWIIAFLISIIFCMVFLSKMYNKWNLSPLISSVTEQKSSAFQIPFPAITICPLTKVKKEILDITKMFHVLQDTAAGEPNNLESDELVKLEALAHICRPDSFDLRNISSAKGTDEIAPTLQTISLKLNKTIDYCSMGYDEINCGDLFTDIMTEEGSCFTYNMLDSSEIFKEDVLDKKFLSLHHKQRSTNWSLQGGYTTSDENTYPERILETGSQSGPFIGFPHNENDTEYICHGYIQGYKVVLHIPGDIPRVSKNYFIVPIKQDVDVSVKPNMITTLVSLAHHSPEKRDCFFNHEKFLKFFKVYTQSNCELECLANFTLNACGCVKFSMPRDNKTLVCSQEQIQCYNEAEEALMKADLIESLKSAYFHEYTNSSYQPCNCLSDCNTITYDYEVLSIDYDAHKALNALKVNMNEYSGLVFSGLSIFIKEKQFTTTIRSENYGLYEFIGNCGGLLGLFMGVSILSIIEIVYYFTLRLCWRNEQTEDSLTTVKVDVVPERNMSQHNQKHCGSLEHDKIN